MAAAAHQSFAASHVHVQPLDVDPTVLLVGLADHGTQPRHYLLVQVPANEATVAKLHVELGDQKNACGADGVQGVCLQPDRLEIDFRPEAGLHPRDVDASGEATLTRLVVTFRVSEPLLERLRAALADGLRACEVPFHYVGKPSG